MRDALAAALFHKVVGNLSPVAARDIGDAELRVMLAAHVWAGDVILQELGRRGMVLADPDTGAPMLDLELPRGVVPVRSILTRAAP